MKTTPALHNQVNRKGCNPLETADVITHEKSLCLKSSYNRSKSGCNSSKYIDLYEESESNDCLGTPIETSEAKLCCPRLFYHNNESDSD